MNQIEICRSCVINWMKVQGEKIRLDMPLKIKGKHNDENFWVDAIFRPAYTDIYNLFNDEIYKKINAFIITDWQEKIIRYCKEEQIFLIEANELEKLNPTMPDAKNLARKIEHGLSSDQRAKLYNFHWSLGAGFTVAANNLHYKCILDMDIDQNSNLPNTKIKLFHGTCPSDIFPNIFPSLATEAFTSDILFEE